MKKKFCYFILASTVILKCFTTYAQNPTEIQNSPIMTEKNDFIPQKYEIVVVEESNDLMDWIDETSEIEDILPDSTEEDRLVHSMILEYKQNYPLNLAAVRARKRTCSAIKTSGHKGQASWYGPGFHGRKTANGERFNKNDLTAAHKTIPFNSIVEVSYRGKTVQVRINDAGPYHGNRIIDLSEKAAKQLGLYSAGTGNVTLRLVSCGRA